MDVRNSCLVFLIHKISFLISYLFPNFSESKVKVGAWERFISSDCPDYKQTHSSFWEFWITMKFQKESQSTHRCHMYAKVETQSQFSQTMLRKAGYLLLLLAYEFSCNFTKAASKKCWEKPQDCYRYFFSLTVLVKVCQEKLSSRQGGLQKTAFKHWRSGEKMSVCYYKWVQMSFTVYMSFMWTPMKW